jgi:hypothetical protein
MPFNGNLVIGKGRTAELGLQSDDAFAIKLGRNQILLVPADAEDETQ